MKKRLLYFMQIIRLGATFRYRIYLAFLVAYFFILRRMGRFPQLKSPARLRLRVEDREIDFYIWHQLDLTLMHDVFIDKEYSVLPTVSSCFTIFDLGSNVGTTVAYFHAKYPDAKIFALEPDPHCGEQLRMTCSALKGDRVVFIPKAVHWKTDEYVTFHSSPDYHWSSSLLDRKETDNLAANTITVEAITLDNLIVQYGIERVDILKFDIEGSEYDVFSYFKSMDKVRYIVGELHPPLFKKSAEDFMKLWPDFEVLTWNPHNNVLVMRNKKITI